MKINTFRNGLAPKKLLPEVLISDKEMAFYRYISLKMAYQQDQAQTVLDGIKPARIGLRPLIVLSLIYKFLLIGK